MQTPDKPKAIPNVNTQLLALIGTSFGLIASVLLPAALIAFILFTAAVIYDQQHDRFNQRIREYVEMTGDEQYLHRIRPLHIKFIIMMAILTLILLIISPIAFYLIFSS